MSYPLEIHREVVMELQPADAFEDFHNRAVAAFDSNPATHETGYWIEQFWSSHEREDHRPSDSVNIGKEGARPDRSSRTGGEIMPGGFPRIGPGKAGRDVPGRIDGLGVQS